MNREVAESKTVYKLKPLIWATVFVCAGLMLAIFYDALLNMVGLWNEKEEYSYAFLLPFVALFLWWQKKEQLEKIKFEGSWVGFIIVAIGLIFFVLGNLATIYVITQYSLLIVGAGLVLSLLGWQGFKIVWAPIVILILIVPLPNFLYQSLSTQLQLISSQIGVMVVRLFGISVYLEGNVIDLGVFKLQVVEACSGLRYLFPLLTLGFIAAYFFKGALWKRLVIFLSSIPITILMNSLRIGIIGVMVEYWGKSMAEGFLHDFEGWGIFMACTGVLIVEMWVLARIGKTKLPLREAFGLEFPAPTDKGAPVGYHEVSKPFFGSAALLGGLVILLFVLPPRIESHPDRNDFSEFPMQLNQWQGKRDRLEQIYIDELKFKDYILADFEDGNRHVVNFYVAYYDSQRKGESAHSPRTCLPAGGWEVKSFAQHNVDGVLPGNQPFMVNRVVIQKGENKQLVYYWFQQRGRVITNEYLVKWYIFWDALNRNRTDGALVRLTVFVQPGVTTDMADQQLTDFLKNIFNPLKKYIPD